jgi:DNA-binding NarL/FixJ family response regulator
MTCRSSRPLVSADLLLDREPTLAQLVREQGLGYACLSPAGVTLESNARAHELAARCQPEAGPEALAELLRQAGARGGGAGPLRLPDDDGISAVEVHVHRLAREAHGLAEDVRLVLLREHARVPSARVAAALGALTARQRQVTLLLAREGLSSKEIADLLAIRPGTVDKHAEQIYRLLGVHSRAELGRLFT